MAVPIGILTSTHGNLFVLVRVTPSRAINFQTFLLIFPRNFLHFHFFHFGFPFFWNAKLSKHFAL